MRSQVIFTASPEFAQVALNEIQTLDRQSKLIQWLDSGIGLIELDTPFSNLAAQISMIKAAFIRHICPVMETVAIENLQSAIAAQIALFDRASTLSVQIRSNTKDINRSELRNLLVDDLIAAGLKVEAKDPAQIISIFCTKEIAYLGFSHAVENLSNWAGGMHRFAHEADQISRAEFKLLEAIGVFNLQLPAEGLALDLGASPGGWTRVLRNRGLSVVAVDPGDLAESLQSDSNITHSRQLVQQYLPNCRDRFDLIVNDMRMAPVDSAKNMIAASSVLKENGLAIMTLKLPSKGVKTVIDRTTALLENNYEVIGIRNLFHNRQEVTVSLAKSE
ncbi:SAM-dependent methyltransferase [Leptolyngbya sp. NIES-2104]|uniref:SAM-dependent methyltransferase n=1 Tax=Leptolyngbya sp. NIES-2104 TaxID=1552121 RepID=UPI00073F9249|nr:SAM-dependent methyltransferase [Leptolyngbya sp. NIES-2104]